MPDHPTDHPSPRPRARTAHPAHPEFTERVPADAYQPDLINHPPHYEQNGPECPGCGRIIQCIDVREGMTACISDAVKYIWRAGAKEGVDPVSDLQKAVWYLQREIATVQRIQAQISADVQAAEVAYVQRKVLATDPRPATDPSMSSRIDWSIPTPVVAAPAEKS